MADKLRNDKDTFLLRKDFFPQIRLLTREQRGDLLTALFAYAWDEELPPMDGVTAMCFQFIRASVDSYADKYRAKCRKNQQNGKRGGRPSSQPGNEGTCRMQGDDSDGIRFEPSERDAAGRDCSEGWENDGAPFADTERFSDACGSVEALESDGPERYPAKAAARSETGRFGSEAFAGGRNSGEPTGSAGTERIYGKPSGSVGTERLAAKATESEKTERFSSEPDAGAKSERLKNNRDNDTDPDSDIDSEPECNTHTVKDRTEGGAGGTNASDPAPEPNPEAARSLLAWIEASVPTVAAMPEPLTEQNLVWMLRKYSVHDIRRIILAMHNKRAYRNVNAYTTFGNFARNDKRLNDGKSVGRGASTGPRRYTYSEYLAMIDRQNGGKYVGSDFTAKREAGKTYWVLTADIQPSES